MTTVTMRVVSTGARATTTRRVKRARRGRATTSSIVATNHRCVERASFVARASEGGDDEESDAYAFGGASGRQGALNRENPELEERSRRHRSGRLAVPELHVRIQAQGWG